MGHAALVRKQPQGQNLRLGVPQGHAAVAAAKRAPAAAAGAHTHHQGHTQVDRVHPNVGVTYILCNTKINKQLCIMISEYPCSSLHTSTMHATTQMHKLNFRPNITTDIHSYAVKFDTIQHHRARRRVNMTNTDIDVQQVLFICHLADLHLPLSPTRYQSLHILHIA